MGQKVEVGGTGYDLKGGKPLIGGTAYAIKKGRTLIGGTGYDIKISGDTLVVIIEGVQDNTASDVYIDGTNITGSKTLEVNRSSQVELHASYNAGVTINEQRLKAPMNDAVVFDLMQYVTNETTKMTISVAIIPGAGFPWYTITTT